MDEIEVAQVELGVDIVKIAIGVELVKVKVEVEVGIRVEMKVDI